MENLKEDVSKAVLMVKKLDYYIKSLRINEDLVYEEQEYKKYQPELIGKSENVFSKLGKKLNNFSNKDNYEKHLEAYNLKESVLDNLTDRAKEENYFLDDFAQAKELSNKIFEKDVYHVARTEFLINVILDNTINYEMNKSTYSKIAELFELTQDDLKDLEKEIKDAYRNISYDKSTNVKVAVMVGSLVAAPLLIYGGIAAFGAVAAAGAAVPVGTHLLYTGIALPLCLAIVAIEPLALGLAAGGISYAALTLEQKLMVRKQFKSLDVNQMAMSLAKTSILMSLVKNSNDPEAKKLYDSYIEQYIDLKSDCDLSLFKTHDDAKASEKNAVFHNADNFLKTKLSLA